MRAHVSIASAALLLTVALSGCLGGSDDALDPSAAEDALQALCPAPCERPLLDEPHNELEPSVAVNPTDPDNILVGVIEAPWDSELPANQDPALVIEPGSLHLSAVVTHDGGTSWARVPLPYLSTAESGSSWNLFCAMADPVVFFGPEGTAYYVGLARGCSDSSVATAISYLFLAASHDGGLTWGEPSIVWQGPFYLHSPDKPWGAIDPATGNLAVSWSAFSAFSSTQELLVSVSTDGGASWSTPPSIVATSSPAPLPGVSNEDPRNYFSVPVWGADGALHVAYTACDGSCMKVATSRDLGQTWVTEEAAAIENVDREGARDVDMGMPYPVLDIDRSGGEHHGRLYLSHPDAESGDYDLVLRWSDDGARTWSDPIRLNDNPVGDGTDQFHHWMDVDEQGVVHAFFLDRRNDPDNLLVQASYARYDPVTGDLVNEHLSAPWHPDPTDTGLPDYGHYEGIAASGGTVAAAWTRVVEPGPDQDPCCGDENIHVAILEDLALRAGRPTGVAS